ncbi:MAG: hypothetical protein J6Y37_16350 [Paludibacteraceae bacterium]|nr:hypothetical protein [Paludibacteraceae bacterium]
MEIDPRMMTNAELGNKMKSLMTEFDNNKVLMAKAYQRMSEISDEYNKLDAILKKRNGINGE